MNAPAAPPYSPADPRSRAAGATADGRAPVSGTAGAADARPQPAAPRWHVQPGRRLDPRGAGGGWRTGLIVLAGALVLVLVGGMATMSLLSAQYRRGFAEVPARTALGTPAEIELSVNVGDIRVRTSDAVDQVTLALVHPGLETAPSAEATALARVDVSSAGPRTRIEVTQPALDGPVMWEDDARDALLLMPADSATAVTVTSSVGGIEITGEHRRIEATSNAGDITVQDAVAAEGIVAHADMGSISLYPDAAPSGAIEATSDMGDVVVELPADAATAVRARSDMGDVTLAAPGSLRYDVRAATDMGAVDVDPELRAGTEAAAAVLDAAWSMGDVTVSR